MQNDLTPEEKLDYIYNYVKKQNRNNIIKGILRVFFWILLIGYFLYMYLVIWPELKKTYVEPILKPFWIQSFSVEEFKNFFINLSDTTKNNSINWSLNINEEQINTIKKLLNK